MRKINAKILAPLMKLTGFRFSKKHRQEETIVYLIVDTVAANIAAGMN